MSTRTVSHPHLKLLDRLALAEGALTISEAPEGIDCLVLADIARLRAAKGEGPVLHIARDDQRASVLTAAFGFFAPDIQVIDFPAWDCLPYDRVSPRVEIASRRMAALAALLAPPGTAPRVILTTVNAALQRVPPRETLKHASFSARPGNSIDFDGLVKYLERSGFVRSGTVIEPGDYAVRGGILDLYPPGAALPYRLDFFGETLDALRTFDPETQRTVATAREIMLNPMSETPLDEASIGRFRSGYRAEFGAATDDDPLYEAVSTGRKHPGMEHWLPLFYERLETIFDYAGDALVSLDHLAEEAREERNAQIEDHYNARVEARGMEGAQTFGAPLYKPLKPDKLYLNAEEWRRNLSRGPERLINPQRVPEGGTIVSVHGRLGRNFAPERAQEDVNVFDAATAHLKSLTGKKHTLVACWSEGSRDRMSTMLKDHGLENIRTIKDWHEGQGLAAGQVGLAILGLEHGFESESVAVITEQDILGDRLVHSAARRRRAENFLREASAITPGDHVVHIDYGIGRYEGLKTIDVDGAPHDCLMLLYADNNRVYLPVENIDLLSRYGSDDVMVELDRLGGAGWQHRKARLKERIREIAHQLIKIAAERELKKAPEFVAPEGLYTEFCARFPYQETDDQERAIADVITDLAKGRPMDRLVCGDVGFGKTEVALRAAFVTAMAGEQVAVVVPTTLLCRQHFQTFSQRFQGLPIKVRQLSRLVPAKDASATRAGIADGTVEIVVGTHALLSKSIKFKNLGLLIVDEEQHFGVKHKERLKEMRANVHVLTLTATPIPRTLQLALSGVRDLSIIATAPVDRLAVRTYVSPFDPVTVREALLREHYRGGQSFYVCPRIADLPEAADFLEKTVPEVKFVIAHGQMPATELEDVMTAFYEGRYDVLCSTTIIESGLDIPSANTLVVHRADMFGLAQLYQIRGRIGRSKTRAYAYLTVPPRKKLTEGAQKRLEVLQALDTLGAGFNLASHDLDIRGAGNLLGEEQSGHIREVGIELYQEMLEEAIATLRSGDHEVAAGEQWAPQINLGTAVLIPESYVPDLDLRLSLYRRLADEGEREGTQALAAELIDRFGPLPREVENLLELVAIKALCRKAGVAKLDAGPKGATISFRNDEFANPAGLVEMITREAGTMKVRPDKKLVVMRDWPDADDRLKGAKKLLTRLSEIAERRSAAA
ncbi:MAG: transcription-repair coupling factor [Alphaproteobacteria bacterium]